MIYVVREGQERGEGVYWRSGPPPGFRDQYYAPRGSRVVKFLSRAAAKSVADWHGGRAVRLLSREEAKRKFAANELRAQAKSVEVISRQARLLRSERSQGQAEAYEATAKHLRARADALWPGDKKC